MGWKYEVSEWWRDITDGKRWIYRQEYEGNSFFRAMRIMFRLKRAGAGCVKFEWR